MHSAMVEQIARRILNVMMKKRPELLIGTFGYENVVEVLENQETILDYVSQSAQLLDCLLYTSRLWLRLKLQLQQR